MTTEVLTYVIGAGATVRAPRGRLFFIKTAASPVTITASGRPGAPIKFSNVTAGLKYGPVPEAEHWEYLEITSAAAQTVEIIIGDDDVEVAGTVSIAGTVSTTEIPSTNFAGATDISCAAGAATILAGPQPTRKAAWISNLSTNTNSFRIGDSGTNATRGIELQPGQTIVITTTSAIYAWNLGASAASLAWAGEF